ncbi:MAG: amino acid lyase [Spirochaetales bacterium]|nr:amino acid lyase [Spirochaetales bacterium]
MLDAIGQVNTDHAPSYGYDETTATAQQLFRDIFGPQTRSVFVYTGTAANIIGLSAVTGRFDAVVCAETAHINTDECGAPESLAGIKLLPIPTKEGKLSPEDLEPFFLGRLDEHRVRPRVVSITQASELGTVYTLKEINEITEAAHQHDMLVHLDGARIANAAASLETNLGSMCSDTGIDLLSLGGTKNGMLFGEAVVLLNPNIGEHLLHHQKQGMQLASKMRYIAAQFLRMYGTDLWIESAQKANGMARTLAERLGKRGAEISYPVESNAVFAVLPDKAAKALEAAFHIHIWDAEKKIYRIMASHDTGLEEIDILTDEYDRILKKE